MTALPRAGEAELVLADASPFFNFAECGALLFMLAYLTGRLRVVSAVRGELQRNAHRPQWASLKTLDRAKDLRREEDLELPADLDRDAAYQLRLSQVPGDPPEKNRGEVETLFVAKRQIE